MDVTPSCTRQSYSVTRVTVRGLAQNSWFIDLEFNRNCCNRWDSYYSLTRTKWVSLWSFSKAKVHLLSSWYCNIHVQAPGAAVPHSHPSWAKLSANLSPGFLPATSETGSWNVSALGKTGPLFSHTHGSAECQGTARETMRTNTLA